MVELSIGMLQSEHQPRTCVITGNADDQSTTAEELWFAMLSDRVSRVPSMRLAELHAQRTTDTYAYLFTWRSPPWEGRLGAGHGVELPFVFGVNGEGP
jgi:carboxylesterase type B